MLQFNQKKADEKSLFDLPWQFSNALEDFSREKGKKSERNPENVFIM
jgi:hypothetical protein